MRVMVLTDASFAHREHQLLTRLEIGLADDGAVILHAVPLRCSPDIVNAFSSTVVRYDDSVAPWGRTARARQLVTNAREALDISDLKIDVVHVFGRQAWQLGERVARDTGAVLVLEIWRAELIEQALTVARRQMGDPANPPLALMTSSDFIGEEMRDAASRAGVAARVNVGVARWGVSVADVMRPPIDPARGFALSVLADGRSGGPSLLRTGSSEFADVRTMLEGIQRASRGYENLLVFLDGIAADRAPVWRAARKLRLLERVTAVAEMEARREPILQTDVLMLPENAGVCRTLPLAAMADGVSVIARPDPRHEDWLNKSTAHLVGEHGRPATPEQWENAIVACIKYTEANAAMRQAARTLIRDERTVTAYIEGVQRFYAEIRKPSPSSVVMA